MKKSKLQLSPSRIFLPEVRYFLKIFLADVNSTEVLILRSCIIYFVPILKVFDDYDLLNTYKITMVEANFTLTVRFLIYGFQNSSLSVVIFSSTVTTFFELGLISMLKSAILQISTVYNLFLWTTETNSDLRYRMSTLTH